MQKQRRLTGADGVVDTLELVARREVLALGCDAAEVVRVVLEAVIQRERRRKLYRYCAYQRRVWLVYGKRAKNIMSNK